MLFIVYVFFLLMRRQPPRSTRTDTLFPYTTLFPSHLWHLLPNSQRPRTVRRRVRRQSDHDRSLLALCDEWQCDANRQLSGVGRASELCPVGYDDPDDRGRQRESEARKLDDLDRRSEERRVGQECVSTGKSRGSPNHYKKK